ncbi:MAG TPA: protease complex subunit PrcB family protein [Polyangia bacterium]|nr:protease complex subunit PrcB family protein [Polyangia bacterium]
MPALALLGCGEGLTNPDDDVQQVAGDVGALGATPDAASTIAFQTFTDDVGKQASTKTRTLIRNARGYQSMFGHAPPAAVDFSREWVMFYAAGTEPTGGYQASFLALLRNGPSLIAITQLASPNKACLVDDVITTPYALIKFPAQPGTSPQFYKSDSITDCNPDPCSYTDCGPGMRCEAGKCVVSCGGIAGIACPGQGKCGDDPNDTCNPAAGGADCPGICSCVQNVLCTTDSKFDSSPAVCACVPTKPPVCGPVCDIYCQYGNVLDANGCPTCGCNPPPADPCATVRCASGTHCDAGKCVSNGVSCGGIAAIPCPGSGKCVDDPNDSCDPAKGGADCGGVCSCVENVLCTANSKFDSSPSVCACVPVTNPCPPEKCPTPAPLSVTTMCADGTTAGPTCALNASGLCAWTITKCPSP